MTILMCVAFAVVLAIILICKLTQSPERDIIDQLRSDLESRPDDFSMNGSVLTDSKTKFQYQAEDCSRYGGVISPVRLAIGGWQDARYKRAVARWVAGQLLADMQKHSPEEKEDSDG